MAINIYSKYSLKFYDENFSKKQYIILNEYESIPTKEELNDKKLSDSMLSDNKIFMGYGKGKNLYYIDLNLMTHLAVVGSTGSGKSNLMNGIITSLLFNLNLIDALYLIDLKGTEFMKYQDIDSSKINLFTKKSTPKVILEALLELEAEIHLRTAYCQNERQVKLKTNPIFLIIDEFKQIDNIYCETSQDHKDKDEIYKSLNRIGSLSRSSNIKMIIQTQGAKDIPEDIRKHCMSRILMKTSLENDSSIHLQNVDKMQELGINHLTFDKGRYILEDDNDGDTKTYTLNVTKDQAPISPANYVVSRGWIYTNGVWSYLDGTGSRTKGWLQISNIWYYFNEQGVMQTGWINDNGTWYYLNEDGSMAYSTVINGYQLGANGAWIQ